VLPDLFAKSDDFMRLRGPADTHVSCGFIEQIQRTIRQ
jgi:hypothetical protein